MPFLQDISVWWIALAIFCLRIVDVSLGTMRTISVVHGRVRLSVLLGFFEILIWVTAVSQVILRIREHPALIVAYASGFATGNAIGIALEKRMALGWCVVRMISREANIIANRLPAAAQVLALFRSEHREEGKSLVFVTCRRRDLPALLRAARGFDPDLFYVVERFSETSHLSPLPHPTGWRAVFKMK